MSRPSTLGQLLASGWKSRSVRHELRDNLVARLKGGKPTFPGLIGYDRTVIPQVQNAILSGHDFILLGLRGQAKTRILRSLVGLLDEELPVIAGGELNDDPSAPVSATARRLLAERGEDTPIAWIGRQDRYREKLATPDVTIADLIGDIDPIKAATRRLDFSDEGVIHYGLVPRTNRGIFAINELPDLQARIQVGLLNILEEGDVQIRGFPVRLPLDLCLVFSANPEDYTNRGNIITPLRDRIASQILTHYPRTLEEGMAITRQEAWCERGGEVEVVVTEAMRQVVEQVGFCARESEFVDQNSGVSARMTIALLENLLSNAERRGLETGESRVVARVSDLYGATAAVTGKIELVYEGEREGVQKVALHLIGRAVKQVFDALCPDAFTEPARKGAADDREVSEYQPVLDWFRKGRTVDVSDRLPAGELHQRLSGVDGLSDLARRHLAPADAQELAAAMEFLLEGLHQSSLLSKEDVLDGRVYRDPFDEMVESLKG